MKTVALTFCPWEVGGSLGWLFEYNEDAGADPEVVWWAFGDYLFLKFHGVPLGLHPHEPTDMDLESIRHGYGFEELPLTLIREAFVLLERFHTQAIHNVLYLFRGQQLDTVEGYWEGTPWSLPVLFLVFDDTPTMLQHSLF